MEAFYYYDYLKQHYNDTFYLELIRYELDQKIYYYGEHFLYPKEREIALKEKLKNYLRPWIQQIYQLVYHTGGQSYSNGIINNAYFGVNRYLTNLGYRSYEVPWNPSIRLRTYSFALRQALQQYGQYLQSATFNELLTEEAQNRFYNIYNILKTVYASKKLVALCVAQDMSFFDKASINIFKELQRPSFVFLHGLPGLYNSIDNHRADYLVVWGKKIKENFLKLGIGEEKILVSGHPLYGSYTIPKNLKFGIDNILVLTHSINGAQQSDKSRPSDRGNLVFYLKTIQSALQKIGVKYVRLRPHPSENPKWYAKFIDDNFFQLDNLPLKKSLQNSSLVIGPTSSVFLDSLMNGVTYIVYEPINNGLNLINYPLVPPFDGSDKRLLLAHTEQQLIDIIYSKPMIDLSILEDYIEPNFDIGFMKKVIN